MSLLLETFEGDFLGDGEVTIGGSRFAVPSEWYGRFYADSDTVRLFGRTAFNANPAYGMGIEVTSTTPTGDAIESLRLIRPRPGGTSTTSLTLDDPLAWHDSFVGSHATTRVASRDLAVTFTRLDSESWSLDLTGDGMDLQVRLRIVAPDGRVHAVEMNLNGTIAGDPIDGRILVERAG